MAATNFDLAPPPKTVDGLKAVPIDVQQVAASLTFDGATSSGSGDATVDFVTGPISGNAIFDLRQTVSAAWLDGAPLLPTKVAHHDFGGGPQAELRIAEQVLAAGSAHTLRLEYSLGTPQASSAGSYQPAMTWSSGPRLAFNFGFTDLGAGRYLEAWIPANLIFDQFVLDLELQVLNTSIAHTVITNGTVTSLGTNHWSVHFPARFTALSPLLEVRATDTLASMTGVATLPTSGNVTIEAWKLASSAVDLNAQITNLKSWLASDESGSGPYLHGNRFVAFVNAGGMEYEGGTTSTPGSLKHETFHSWFGRGVKPASQADAWWDEAWDVYNDLGATGMLPFDFTDPAVELSSRNPWVRVTPVGAYSSGERFFEGVASLVGVANLKSHLRAFYNEHRPRPATTADLETLLVRRSGEQKLVDAFHRFVYGFPDPSPPPDLWLRDDPADPGSDFWAGRFWDSPDLWIRNADDGGTTHQPVEHGQDNWFYARVRNRSMSSSAKHFVLAFNVKPFLGTQFVYPGDFLPCISAVAGFDLGPGESRIVKARWPAALVPPAGTHACWLAVVLTRGDNPTVGVHVWEDNNLAQKNLAVVDAVPDSWMLLPFVVNRFVTRVHRPMLELVRPPGAEKIAVSLLHRSGAPFVGVAAPLRRPAVGLRPLLAPADARHDGWLDCGGGLEADADAPTSWTARQFEDAAEVPFEPGLRARIPLTVTPAGQLVFGMRIHVPRDAKPGTAYAFDLLQRDNGRVAGGFAVHVRVRRRT
jgi:hypothetical protein